MSFYQPCPQCRVQILPFQQACPFCRTLLNQQGMYLPQPQPQPQPQPPFLYYPQPYQGYPNPYPQPYVGYPNPFPQPHVGYPNPYPQPCLGYYPPMQPPMSLQPQHMQPANMPTTQAPGSQFPSVVPSQVPPNQAPLSSMQVPTRQPQVVSNQMMQSSQSSLNRPQAAAGLQAQSPGQQYQPDYPHQGQHYSSSAAPTLAVQPIVTIGPLTRIPQRPSADPISAPQAQAALVSHVPVLASNRAPADETSFDQAPESRGSPECPAQQHRPLTPRPSVREEHHAPAAPLPRSYGFNNVFHPRNMKPRKSGKGGKARR